MSNGSSKGMITLSGKAKISINDIIMETSEGESITVLLNADTVKEDDVVNVFNDVYTFATTFLGGNTPRPTLGFPPRSILEFREKFIVEEGVTEFQEANIVGDFVGSIDALMDTLWVVLGAMMCYGVTEECFKELWKELVRSNTLDKLWEDGKPRWNPDNGKVLKPPTWTPPNFLNILVKHGYVLPSMDDTGRQYENVDPKTTKKD